jgi:hypothetical protein
MFGEIVPPPAGLEVVDVGPGSELLVVEPLGCVEVVVIGPSWVVVVDPFRWVVVVVGGGGAHGSMTVKGRATPTCVTTPLIVLVPITRRVLTPT